jgi:hypothetical protein
MSKKLVLDRRNFMHGGKDMAKARTTVKTGTGKAAPKKAAAKKTVAKKTARKAAGMKEGSRYVCGVCGLAVTVDTACGCAETSHLICCEKPMKMKR